ncbi:hypothetical protein [Chitinophaga jiangningensis]|nr:hypothetical protein [Chitinophaga jiangningensis]
MLVALLLANSGKAQQVKFDKNSVVNTLNYETQDFRKKPDRKCHFLSFKRDTARVNWRAEKRDWNKNKPVRLDSIPAVSSQDTVIKAEIRREMLKKIDTAIASLDPSRELYLFLKGYYGDHAPADLKQQLGSVRSFLAGNQPGVNASHKRMLDSMPGFINKYLFTESAPVFTLSGPEKQEGFITRILSRTYPDNKFLIDFYNHTSAHASVYELTADKLAAFAAALDSFAQKSVRVRDTMNAAKDTASVRIALDAMQRFHNELQACEGYQYLKDSSKKNWLYSWSWLHSDQLMINPLEFTTESNYKNHPLADDRAQDFDQYIDSLIARYKRYDTSGRVEDFKKILAMKKSGSDLFNQKEKIKQLTDENNAKMAKFTLTGRNLNEIKLPEKTAFYLYSTSKDFKSNNNSDKYLTRTVTEGESKTVVLLNVPAGQKSGLLENISESPDQSAIGKLVDTLAGSAVQIFSYASQYGAAGAVLSALTTLPKVAPVKFSNNSNAFMVSDRSVFEEFKAKVPPLHRDAELLNKTNQKFILKQKNTNEQYIKDSAQKSLIQEMFSSYMDDLTQKYTARFPSDSLQALYLSRMLANATLVPKKLDTAFTKEPLLTTGVFETSTSNKSNTEIITPYYTKAEDDTVKLKSFEYERGKHHRFQLSAGLAYTAQHLVQSTAKQENGQITISNQSQQYQLGIGLHIHLGKGLVLKDERFAGKFLERSSVYVGIGIPEPLGNLYLGYSYDFFPGLKSIVGAHFYRQNQYEILNNVIVEERLEYRMALPFFAIQVDPAGLLKALNVIKSN